MKKQVLCLALPLLLGLAGCSSQEGPSKGSKIDNVEQKRAIVDEVIEGVAKNIGLQDFTFELNAGVNGTLGLEEASFAFDHFGAKLSGAFDFPAKLEKGSDVENIKAYMQVVTSGSFSAMNEGTTVSVDCSATTPDAEFYFDEGTIYGDVYETSLTNFIVMAGVTLDLPIKSKLDLASLIDPDKVIDLQEDFESPEIPDEVVSQLDIYVSEETFTFEVNTNTAVSKDETGAEKTVKELFGVDGTVSLSIDKQFRFKSFSLDANVDVAKVDDSHSRTGNLDLDLSLALNYQDSPTVKQVADKESYEVFKLF